MLLINKQLLKLGRNAWGWILAIVMTKLVILGSMIMVIAAVSSLVGSVVGEGQADTMVQILIACVSTLLGLVGNLVLSEIKFQCTAKIRIRLRHDIYQKMLDLEMDYLVKMGTSNAITASIDGIEALEKYYSEYLPDLIYCFIAPFILFWRIYVYSHLAAWLLLLLSLTVIPANAVFKKLMSYLRTEYWDTFNSLNDYFLESLEGMTTLKLMNQDKERSRIMKERSFGYYHMIVKTMRVSFYSTIVTQAFIYGGMLCSTLILIRDCRIGILSASAVFYSLMLAYTFFRPVQDLINTGHTAMNGVAAASNIFSFLNLIPARTNGQGGFLKGENTDGVWLNEVTFSYDGVKQVLKNVSIHIPKGSTVAFAGQSGCGKSTLVNLIMHFNEPSKGNVFLEGSNIQSLSQEELRRKISLVPQSTYIFSGTVRDNLKIVDSDITDEEMLKVMKDVHLEALIEKDGLMTDVGEGGSKLSGGQKQKIGIARALLSNAEYLVFDEATSNVDAESEEDIWDCIHKLDKKKTLIIISHRLSTIRNADIIYLLKHGEVIQKGKHEDLLQEKGLYVSMVEEQNALEHYNRRTMTDAEY